MMGMSSPQASEIEEVQAGECESCGLSLWEEAGPALYGCGSCGEVFNRDNSADGESARCPQCQKFSGKIADESCPQCEQEELIGPVAAWECPACNELHETKEQAAECCPDGQKKVVERPKVQMETTQWFRGPSNRERHGDWWLVRTREPKNWKANIKQDYNGNRWLWEIHVDAWQYISAHDASGEAPTMEAAMKAVEDYFGIAPQGLRGGDGF